MVERYININLEDPRAGIIAEALANKTCKKILTLLSDMEMSESEIAKEIGSPLNTTEYNLEKLVKAGLIEKSEKFLWSSKGKKIDNYKIINKKIIISPKSTIRGVVPAIVASVILALGIKFFSVTNYISNSPAVKSFSADAPRSSMTGVSNGAESIAQTAINPVVSSDIYSPLMNSEYLWLWFLLGALASMVIFLIWNWRKI